MKNCEMGESLKERLEGMLGKLGEIDKVWVKNGNLRGGSKKKRRPITYKLGVGVLL